MMDSEKAKTNPGGSASEITGWVLVILGAVLAIAAGRQVAGLFEVRDAWKETRATVTRTRLSGETAARRAATNSASQTGSNVRVYQEIVYFVKGNRYQETLEAGRFSTSAAARQFVAEAGRPGAETLVWVDSRNPANVKTEPVERTASGWSVALFALLGLVAVQGGSSLISASAKRAKMAQEPAGISAQAITLH